MIIFDAQDIDYLVKSLSVPQLRHEISSSRKRQSYYLDNYDTNNEVIEIDFQKACQFAIELAMSVKEKPEIVRTASKIPHVNVDDLKYSLDIISIAERYTKLRKSGSRYTGICPFHSEKSPSFWVYPDTNRWYCYGACNTGGDVISLVMKAENIDFKSALTVIKGY
jgi:hypothetical protein